MHCGLALLALSWPQARAGADGADCCGPGDRSQRRSRRRCIGRRRCGGQDRGHASLGSAAARDLLQSLRRQVPTGPARLLPRLRLSSHARPAKPRPTSQACSLPARRQKFWPPTRQSAPQLLAGWLGLAYVLWIFIREKRNKAVEQVAAAQRRPAFASAALHCSGLHRKSRCSQH